MRWKRLDWQDLRHLGSRINIPGPPVKTLINLMHGAGVRVIMTGIGGILTRVVIATGTAISQCFLQGLSNSLDPCNFLGVAQRGFPDVYINGYEIS